MEIAYFKGLLKVLTGNVEDIITYLTAGMEDFQTLSEESKKTGDNKSSQLVCTIGMKIIGTRGIPTVFMRLIQSSNQTSDQVVKVDCKNEKTYTVNAVLSESEYLS